MNSKKLLGLLAASGFLVSPALAIVSIDYVTVGDLGNSKDPSTGFGAVSYEYQIGKYEVTNRQYTEFLNAAAKSDPYGLYNSKMATYGISQTGTSNDFSYNVTGGLENRPVSHVSWFDAVRFINWLQNGQGSGATETGAYTLNGVNSGIVLANAGATIRLPTENEWYKAAYYNGSDASYWNYPNQSDYITTAHANYANLVGAPTDVGSYPNDASYYGTFDQGGNVWEWNDAVNGALRSVRGGAWESYDYLFRANGLHAEWRGEPLPTGEYANVGFRVASIPEPGTGVLWFGIAVIFLRRSRRNATTRLLHERLAKGRLARSLPCSLPGFGNHLFQRRSEGVRPIDPERQGRDSITRFGPVQGGAVEIAGSRQRVHGHPGGNPELPQHVRHLSHHPTCFLACHSAVSQTRLHQ